MLKYFRTFYNTTDRIELKFISASGRLLILIGKLGTVLHSPLKISNKFCQDFKSHNSKLVFVARCDRNLQRVEVTRTSSLSLFCIFPSSLVTFPKLHIYWELIGIVTVALNKFKREKKLPSICQWFWSLPKSYGRKS